MGAVDPRVGAYAELLVERCLDVQPGWQVLIRSQPGARPALDQLARLIAQRGAYPLLRMNFSLWPTDDVWAALAPEELVAELSPIDVYASDHMDARITMEAPDNARGAAALTPERRALARRASAPFFRRTMTHEIPWVSCQFPTNALAQEAGMRLADFEDFFYGACLRDWDEEARSMQRLNERFDAAEQVRIVGEDTDLKLSLAGRKGEVDGGFTNMPGGEFFFAPVEDSAEGTILFDIPTELDGGAVDRIRLTFRSGRVEDAHAEQGEETLLAALAMDDGARFVGELGIGCNEGITRPARNILFDEKMAGTIHMALGQSYTHIGGKNVSSLHWDLIKDLRQGGRIELDGEVVQENGTWLI
ncbi:MAG TPA: aminopeptidase [Gaiellaceae bacterium]|nr:aminopeptidase [Gaiellaceae bacterium]